MEKRGFNYKLVLLFLFILAVLLFGIRVVLPKHLDDVSPEISCDEELLQKADVFYIIPKFNGIPISENLEWCQKILSYDKELALHGLEHTYKEFGRELREENLLEGIKIFEECFGFKPEKFKPPQVLISSENKKMIKDYLDLDGKMNQILHKVYHCNDTGFEKNWVSDLV